MLDSSLLPQVQYEVVSLNGGFDQKTSAYTLQPGALRDDLNFACKVNGGYYRIPGYERFDGRAKPHNAPFITLAITLLLGKQIAIGDIGTFGNLSGQVTYINPTATYLSIVPLAGASSFPDLIPGPIVISADTKGSVTDYYLTLTLRESAILKSKAANAYRSRIGAVPGSGPILGVCYFNDVAYAVRNNAGGTAADFYKSTTSGWVKVPLGSRDGFTAMTALPGEGATLTQGAASAKIERWVTQSGDIADDSAAGYFILSNVVGTFTAAAATFPGGTCNLTGAVVANTLLPGGTYNFQVGNFSAFDANRRMFGADGVNDAFEFDGTIYVPLIIPGIHEKPRYVMPFANHLFLAVGSSLIHSAIGNPYNYEVINGAGEIGTGGNVTGMVLQPGTQNTNAMMVWARNSTWVLYGTNAADWKFVNYNVGIGGWDRSMQNLFDCFSMDDRGVTMSRQSLNYGNFDSATLTHNIQPFIESMRGLITCSGLSRENSQYRAYFNNGLGLYVTVSTEGLVGHGIVLFPDPPTCYYDGEQSNGETVALFGTATGIVMQNDVGTSFDGQVINAQIMTNINAVKSPRVRKRFRRAVIELQADYYLEFDVGYAFEWSSIKISPHLYIDLTGDFSKLPYWDNMVWDTFFWDGRLNDAISVDLAGTGENVQFAILTSSDFIEEYTVPSVILHYTLRRGNR